MAPSGLPSPQTKCRAALHLHTHSPQTPSLPEQQHPLKAAGLSRPQHWSAVKPVQPADKGPGGSAAPGRQQLSRAWDNQTELPRVYPGAQIPQYSLRFYFDQFYSDFPDIVASGAVGSRTPCPPPLSLRSRWVSAVPCKAQSGSCSLLLKKKKKNTTHFKIQFTHFWYNHTVV